MKRAALALSFISVLLLLVGTQFANLTPAQYNGFINFSINADGSLTPSTSHIERSGNIYTLTGDILGSIKVARSNIIFDGDGHAIIGGPNEIGVGGLIIGSLPTAPTAGVSYLSNVTVKNFKITGSAIGISLWHTSEVTITNNSISGTGNGVLALGQRTAGIDVEGGGSNTITGNNVSNNYNAMSFIESEDNLIVQNKIINNHNPYLTVSAVMFWGASNNTIVHNNFINNTSPAGNTDSINVWDDGFPGGGNYWSDYLTKYPRAQMIGDSGIGNFSYVIDSQNMDRFPLLEEFAQFQILATTPPKILVISPLSQTYNETSVALLFTSDKLANWTGYSLDGKDNVTVAGNSTLSGLPDGAHNVTVYAQDSFGNVAASENIAFTVANLGPFMTDWGIAAAGASAIAVAAGLLVYFKKTKH
jgi:parallel beta-helix repeat protein